MILSKGNNMGIIKHVEPFPYTAKLQHLVWKNISEGIKKGIIQLNFSFKVKMSAF